MFLYLKGKGFENIFGFSIQYMYIYNARISICR